LLQWKIDIKSEEEKRQEVEQQMQAMSGGPATPIESVTELGESVMEKLITAGITTVESLADMTAEELSEIPGIGEKTVEKIAVAVRHYFGQYEEGEVRPEPVALTPAVVDANAEGEPVLTVGETAIAAAAETDPAGDELHSLTLTPEEIIANYKGREGAQEVGEFSSEDIADAEDRISESDANDDADAREEAIERDNDTIDQLVDDAQEVSDEGIDDIERDRG
jgi:N utilization substance protein A